MKRHLFAAVLLVLPAMAKAQEVVTDPDTHTLIQASTSVEQQILSVQLQILTELKVIAAQNSVPPSQRAIVAAKVRQKAAAAATGEQPGKALTSVASNGQIVGDPGGQ